MKRIWRWILNATAAALLAATCTFALLWIAGRYSPQEIYRHRHVLGATYSTATDTDDYLDFSEGEISLFHHREVGKNESYPQDQSDFSYGYGWGDSGSYFEQYKVSLPPNFSPRLGFAAAYLGNGVHYFVIPLWLMLLTLGWLPVLRFVPMANAGSNACESKKDVARTVATICAQAKIDVRNAEPQSQKAVSYASDPLDLPKHRCNVTDPFDLAGDIVDVHTHPFAGVFL